MNKRIAASGNEIGMTKDERGCACAAIRSDADSG